MRRHYARTLAEGYERGKTEDDIKAIIDVQHAIDAIDRAASDEDNLTTMGL